MRIVLPAIAIYLGGLLVGLTLVSFPASSAYLVNELALTNQEYGSIYLSQLTFAIVGAIGGGMVVRSMSVKLMYVLGLAAFVASQSAFALSVTVRSEVALPMIMIATGLFGFGFGFGGGPLNSLASTLSERFSNSAVTLLHMMAGLGMSAAPLIFAYVIRIGAWVFVPVGLASLALVLILICAVTRFPAPMTPPQQIAGTWPSRSAYFWLIMAVASLYALTEGVFANWAILYVQDAKGLDAQTAASALAAFWGSLTLGRLFASLVLVRFPPIALLLALPPLMAVALLLIPQAATPSGVISAYAIAGLACSAFFPLLITIVAEPFPHAISYIASMLTAALMFGVGVGSYGIGSLRSSLSLEMLYSASTVFPIAALILIVIARRIMRQMPRST